MRAPKLRLIAFENRIVPATINWDGGPTGNGSDWFDPVNWKGDVVPGANDYAIIDATGTSPLIEIAQAAAIHYTNCGRPLSIGAGGSLSVGAGNSAFNDVVLNGGTVDLQDGAVLSFANFKGNGSLTIESGRTVQLYLCASSVPTSVKGTLIVSTEFSVRALLTVEQGGKVVVGAGTPETALDLNAGLVNHGTLELTSVGMNQNAAILVDGASLTNAKDGTIVTRVGMGGVREIKLGPSMQLINQGQIAVESGLNITRSGSGQLVVNSGSLQVEGGQTCTVNTAFQQSGGLMTGSGTATVSSLALDGDLTLGIPSLTIGNLSGAGKLTIPVGSSVQTLPPTQLNAPIDVAGTLIVHGSCTMGATLSVASTGTVRIRGDAGSVNFRTTAAVANAGAFELNSIVTANNATLTVQSGSFTNALTGLIKVFAGDGGSRFLTVSSGTLIQQGQITLVDTNLNYSGPTLANSGTISLGNGTTLSTTAAITNANPGSIIGTGTIKASALTGNGTTAPGFSAGRLTLNNSVNLSGPFVVDLNGKTAGTQHDQLKVLGGVTLSGPLTVNLGYVPQVDDSFIVIDNDGSDTISGTFATLADGDTITVNSAIMVIDYQGDTGNDVTLRVLAVGTPPPTAMIQVNDGAPQRSMVTAFHVTFSEGVTFPDGTEAAFRLRRTGPSDPINDVALEITGSGTTYDLHFNDNQLAPGLIKSLIDGFYTLTLHANKIQGAGGALNGGTDDVLNTHRLFGDFNGDHSITTDDFAAFRGAFGQSSTIFDFDGAGGVNTDDFAAFRGRFGMTLLP